MWTIRYLLLGLEAARMIALTTMATEALLTALTLQWVMHVASAVGATMAMHLHHQPHKAIVRTMCCLLLGLEAARTIATFITSTEALLIARMLH